MTIDDRIDRLYQLSLAEFTAARNALAKEVRGADATKVRTLQKPNVAAWAVNQLYWKQRRAYDQLIKAAEQLHAAHRALVAGKSVDVQNVEAAHREAARAAADHIRQILGEAGEAASPATMTAVSETLDALPAAETPGRLTRPLRRVGFEALAGVPPAHGRRPDRSLQLVKTPPATAAPPPAKTRELEALEAKARTAQTEERQTREALERARRELERAENAEARVRQELDEATEKATRQRAEMARLDKAHKAALAATEKIEERLGKVRPV